MDERRPIYRRDRARDSAPALFALLRPRDAHLWPLARKRDRAVRRAVHARHGDARDLPDIRTTTDRPVYHYPEDVDLRDGEGFLKDGTEVEIIPSAKMSKSKNNVVDPVAIIDQYGADTARWFVLSDSPPERDVEWTAAGAEAAFKHLSRVHRISTEIAEGTDTRFGR